MFKNSFFKRGVNDKKEDFVHYLNNEDFLEKRMTARLDLPIKVEYKIYSGVPPYEDEIFYGIAKNVSQGGCLLLATREIPQHSHLEISLLLDENSNNKLLLAGEIIRLSKREKNLYEYGLSFSLMKRDDRNKFSDFCFKKMYEIVGLNDWPTERAKNNG